MWDGWGKNSSEWTDRNKNNMNIYKYFFLSSSITAVSDHPALTGNSVGSATEREANPLVKCSSCCCYSCSLIHFNSEIVKSSRQEWKYTPVIQLLWIFRWSAPWENKLEQTIKLSGDLWIRCYEANAQLPHVLFEVCSLSTGGKYTKPRLEVIETHRAVTKQSVIGEHSSFLCPSSWGKGVPWAFVHWTPGAAAFLTRSSCWKYVQQMGEGHIAAEELMHVSRALQVPKTSELSLWKMSVLTSTGRQCSFVFYSVTCGLFYWIDLTGWENYTKLLFINR